MGTFAQPVPLKPQAVPRSAPRKQPRNFPVPLLPSPSVSPTNADSLHALLHDCFQLAVDPDSVCDSRAETAKRFQKYLESLHTAEHLNFVIEIYRYEYYYAKIERHEYTKQQCADLSRSVLNHSLTQFLDSLPEPTIVRRPKKCIGRLCLRMSSESRSSSLLPTGHLSDDEPSNFWDDFKNSNVSDELDQELLVLDSEDSVLAHQWRYIMSQFVVADSPQQVNISNTVASVLAKQNGAVHSPSLLFDAKEEVIQLIRENGYSQFLAQQRKEVRRRPPIEHLEPSSSGSTSSHSSIFQHLKSISSGHFGLSTPIRGSTPVKSPTPCSPQSPFEDSFWGKLWKRKH